MTEQIPDARVDKTLVAMFLKMSPDERLRMNDNAVTTILELRHAFQKYQSDKCKSRINP